MQLSLEKEEISGTIYTDADHMGRVVLPKPKKNKRKRRPLLLFSIYDSMHIRSAHMKTKVVVVARKAVLAPAAVVATLLLMLPPRGGPYLKNDL